MAFPKNKILTCYVVDDEQHAVDATSDYILRTEGLQLNGASTNPLQAITEVAKPGGPDLTFLDVDMPKMSGISFAELAKPYTTIIFTTADPRQLRYAFPDESFECLAKPFSYEKFLACIKKIRK